MKDELPILRSGLTGILRDARDSSDAYYAQIIEHSDETDPLYPVPKKLHDWTPAEHERLAVWNAYTDAMRHAIQLDIEHHNVPKICEALALVEEIESRSSVRHDDAPSFAASVREGVLALSRLWLISP